MNRIYILFIVLILSITIFSCDQNVEHRKIKLSNEQVQTQSNQQLTTTIHLEPQERRSIAVLMFENLTGDHNLKWLQQGLTEMLIRTLSQSQNLSVLSTDRLFEILERLGQSHTAGDYDVDIAAIVAKAANVEAVLTGNITKKGQTLQINVKVREPNYGHILKEESVEGVGLENIFSMVDQLTAKIRSDLHLTLEKGEAGKSITAISTNSLDAWRHYTSGVELMYKALLPEGTIELAKAVECDSSFVSAYLRLCLMKFALGEINEGYDIFHKLLNLKLKATQQELYQIDLLKARLDRDLGKLIEVSQQWLQQYPDDRDAALNLADTYFYLHNYDKAVDYYKQTLSVDPNYKIVYNMLGYVHAYKGDFDKAISSLEQYLKLATDEPNPYDSMGEIYLYKGDFKHAEKSFKRALKINNTFTPSMIHLGNTYFDDGEYQKALTAFEQSLDYASDRVSKGDAFEHIASAHWRLGNMTKAVDNYVEAFKYRNDPYRIARRMNDLYLNNGDTLTAQKILEESYQKLKNLTEDNSNLVRSLANLSLWYDINIEETTDLLIKLSETADTESLKRWSRFYLTLLYLKTNQVEKEEQLSAEFGIFLIDNLKSIRDIFYDHFTWNSFLIYNQFAYNQTDKGIQKYNQLIQLCREYELNTLEMLFQLFLADLYYNSGDINNAIQLYKHAGVPEESKWLVIGPFDNKNGFHKKFPPEKEINFSKIYEDQSKTIMWQQANDGVAEGYINLKQIFSPNIWSVAYGLIYINSPQQQPAQFRIGTNEAVKLWLNGKQVWTFNRVRDAIFDDDVVDVSLKPGLNKMLIKVSNRLGDWGFYFRVTDNNGHGLTDIEFISPKENAIQLTQTNVRCEK